MSWAKLRRLVTSSLNKEELRTLCFDLGVDFDNLSGQGKEARIRELIAVIRRNREIPRLVKYLSEIRPNIQWTEMQLDESWSEGLESTDLSAFEKIQQQLRLTKPRDIDIFGLSAHNYDTFIRVDKIQPDHESEIIHPSISCPGGSGANTVFALSKLGKRTAVAGAICDDAEGNALIDSLSSVSVDTDLILRTDTNEKLKSGKAFVLVDPHGRRFILTLGVN